MVWYIAAIVDILQRENNRILGGSVIIRHFVPKSWNQRNLTCNGEGLLVVPAWFVIIRDVLEARFMQFVQFLVFLRASTLSRRCKTV